MKKIVIVLLLLGLTLSVNSCMPTSPIKYYPNFKKERLLIDSVSVLTDVLLYNSEMGGNYVIEDEQYEQLRDSINTFVAEALTLKGYSISKLYKSELYCADSSRMEIKGVTKYEKIKIPPRSTGRIGKKRNGKKSSGLDKRTYLFLHPMSGYSLLTKIFPYYFVPIDTSDRVSDYNEMDVLALVLVRGANVSAGKQVAMVAGSIIASAAMNAGTGFSVTVYQSSTIDMTFYLIDRRTRQVLWKDRTITRDDPTNIINVKKYLKAMLDSVPGRRTIKSKPGN